jgi:flagellin
MSMMNTSINGAARGMMSHAAQAQKAKEKSNAQLSSGKRITNAAVDPSAMAIVEKMIAQLGGLNQASRNVQDGISMMQTAEGAMSGIGEMTARINELTVQASNATYTKKERQAMQLEIDQLVEEVNGMASRTEFNEKKLLDGSLSAENGGMWVQAGANSGQGINMSIESLMADKLGLSGINVVDGGYNAISSQIGNSQGALDAVTTERSRMGAYINRMEHTSNALGVMSENMEIAKSRIADADMAKAMMDNVKAGIMSNVSMGMMRNMMTNEYSMRTTMLSVMGP